MKSQESVEREKTRLIAIVNGTRKTEIRTISFFVWCIFLVGLTDFQHAQLNLAFFLFLFLFLTLPIQLGTSPLSLRLRPISCPLLLTRLPSLSLSLPGCRGLVFAHASLAVHLEQLLSSLLRLQIDRERAAWARLAFCLLPECVGLDGSQPENALPVRVSSVRACRTTTGVFTSGPMVSQLLSPFTLPSATISN